MQKSFSKRLFTATEMVYNFISYYVDSFVIFNLFLLPFFIAALLSFCVFDGITPTKNRMAMLFFELIFLGYAGEWCVRNRIATERGRKSLSAIWATVVAVYVAFILFSFGRAFADESLTVLGTKNTDTVTVEAIPIDIAEYDEFLQDERIRVYNKCVMNEDGFYDNHSAECDEFVACMTDSGYKGTNCDFISDDYSVIFEAHPNMKKFQFSLNAGPLGISSDDMPGIIKEIIERDGNAYIWLFQHVMVGDEEFRDYDTNDVTSLDVVCALWDALSIASASVFVIRAGGRVLLGTIGRYESASVLEAVSEAAGRKFSSTSSFIEAAASDGVTSEGIVDSIKVFTATEDGLKTLYSGLKYTSNQTRSAFVQRLERLKNLLSSDLSDARNLNYNESVIKKISEEKNAVSFVRKVADKMQQAANEIGTFENVKAAIKEFRGLDTIGEGLDIAIRNEGKVILIDGALNVIDGIAD